MNKKLILGLILLAAIVFLGINFGQYLTLENAKAQQEALTTYIDQNFVFSAAIYFFYLHCNYRFFYPRSGSSHLTWCSLIWFLDKLATGFFR